ncbi:hypothetical protein PILCRDRAFT_8744 [Piloderma croceum F 1598]|uniref:Uncharacterized protein n=1 Tax=Piloderma croceum (strain F 1598) TaxID=765440 RepID=A0A0C3BVI1_PILCF|nr:hypothetical protein PILCRDRAFT_8744 [Piloderma croceum F 1598]
MPTENDGASVEYCTHKCSSLSFCLAKRILHITQIIEDQLRPSSPGALTSMVSEDSTSKTEDKVKGRLHLNVVVGQCVAILKLFPGKDETLLVRGILYLSHCLDIVDRVQRLNLESLPHQGLDKDLHTTAQTKDEVKGRFFPDIVVQKGAPIV